MSGKSVKLEINESRHIKLAGKRLAKVLREAGAPAPVMEGSDA